MPASPPCLALSARFDVCFSTCCCSEGMRRGGVEGSAPANGCWLVGLAAGRSSGLKRLQAGNPCAWSVSRPRRPPVMLPAHLMQQAINDGGLCVVATRLPRAPGALCDCLAAARGWRRHAIAEQPLLRGVRPPHSAHGCIAAASQLLLCASDHARRQQLCGDRHRQQQNKSITITIRVCLGAKPPQPA